jgi:AcrR family transcriptional regulator
VAGDISRQNATLAPDSVPRGFTPAQALAMGSLLAGKAVTTSARAAGVSRATVHRWLSDDPAFLAYYNQARREMAESVEQGLRLLSATAVVTLRRMLTRKSVPDAVKLRAAEVVLRLAQKPIQGPTDPEDAANLIANREQSRCLDRLISGRGGPTAAPLGNRVQPIEGDGSDDEFDGV